MSTFDTTIGDLGDVVERGLRRDLKLIIKDKLQRSIDSILEEMAIEIAENIVVRIETLQVPPSDVFGERTRVVVNFNLKDPPMVYDSITKEMKRREVLKK